VLPIFPLFLAVDTIQQVLARQEQACIESEARQEQARIESEARLEARLDALLERMGRAGSSTALGGTM